MNTWSNSTLQESNSPVMLEFEFLHDHLLLFIFIISLVVFYQMFMLIFNKEDANTMVVDNHPLEVYWTSMPIMLMLLLSLPSLTLLYVTEEQYDHQLTLKTTGHQWYWSYEYPDFEGKIMFNSYMLTEIAMHTFRLLDVDNRTMLPMNSYIRVLVTSDDVIHSWSVPSIGVKTDGTPGRLNQIFFYLNRPGLYFGQCAEICGANHSFMPIVIESINMKSFLSWIKTSLSNK